MSENLPTHLDSMKVTDAMLQSGSTLKEMNLPQGSLVMMIRRGKEFIVPNGTIEIKKNDILLVIKTT